MRPWLKDAFQPQLTSQYISKLLCTLILASFEQILEIVISVFKVHIIIVDIVFSIFNFLLTKFLYLTLKQVFLYHHPSLYQLFTYFLAWFVG